MNKPITPPPSKGGHGGTQHRPVGGGEHHGGNSGGGHGGQGGDHHHRRGREELLVVPGYGYGYGNYDNGFGSLTQPYPDQTSGYYDNSSSYNQGGGYTTSSGTPRRRGAGGPGWFDGLIKQFYDPKKGGLQIGGLLGAIAGGMLGMEFLGTGSWLGIIAMGVMTLAGAWGGNKVAGSLSSAMPSGDDSQDKKPPAAQKVKQAAAAPETPQNQITNDIQQQALAVTGSSLNVTADGQNNPKVQIPAINALKARQDTPPTRTGK